MSVQLRPITERVIRFELSRDGVHRDVSLFPPDYTFAAKRQMENVDAAVSLEEWNEKERGKGEAGKVAHLSVWVDLLQALGVLVL